LSPSQLSEIILNIAIKYGHDVYIEPNPVGNLQVGKDGFYIGFICFRKNKFVDYDDE